MSPKTKTWMDSATMADARLPTILILHKETSPDAGKGLRR